MFSDLSGRDGGVMRDPTVAIRDPIFWRWHRFIDDISATWLDRQPAYDFADAPPIHLRNDLSDGTTRWKSPDIILVRTGSLPAGVDTAQLMTDAFAGTQWDVDRSDGPVAIAGLPPFEAVTTLTTRFQSMTLAGRTVKYLTHEPFGYALRIANPTTSPKNVTVRVFLAPTTRSGDRRAWIELDKTIYTAPPGQSVFYQPDTKFSVIKKPAEPDPTNIHPGGGDPNDSSYCDCGWPYTLLIPRGSPTGLNARVAVICTDANIDNAAPEGECGSMSFCGAVDRYPDSRDMGYPFSKPLASPIADTLVMLENAAGRSITIQHQK